MKSCKRTKLHRLNLSALIISTFVVYVGLLSITASASETPEPTDLLKSQPAGEVTFEPNDDEVDVPERFRMDEHTFSYWQSKESRFLGKVRVSKVLFPSPIETQFEKNNTVHCEYFAPVGTGERPGVIVLHILGGDFELSRVICRALATSGTGALFVKMPYYGPRRDKASKRRMISEDTQQTVEGMTQAVVDIRRAVTWLESRDEIDADQLGIVGISLGGIVGSLTASIEPRFARACLVLAGGDFGALAFESRELEDLRENWAGPNITIDEVREQLKPIDPITYAHRLKGREVLMMNAKFDKVIPRKCTEALWERFGKPEIIWWDAGHYTAALFLPAGLGRMSVFFGDRNDVELARKATAEAK